MNSLLTPIYNDEEEDDPLQIQFKSLEMEWDSIKHSFSRSNRRSFSSSTLVGNHLLFQLYDSSPKELMSSLQNENPPNSGHRDPAAIETEYDFDDGRIKGRRLFEESDVGSDDYGGIHGGCSDMDEKSEVSTECSRMGSESYDENCTEICGFQLSCTNSLPYHVAERGVKGGGGGSGGFLGRRWFYVAIMLFALAIVAFKCCGEDAQILVPT